MKHLFYFAFVLVLSYSAKAQIGITTGMNVTKYKISQGSTSYKRKSIIEYNIGLFYRTPGKNLCIQPTLAYTIKGAKNDNLPYTSTVYYYRNKLQYIQASLPVMIHGGDRTGDFYFGIGPYAALLTAGKSKAVDYDDNETTTKFKIGNSDSSDFKPVDMGLNFIMGFRVYSVGMSLQYDLGLANIDPIADQKIKTRNFSMNLLFYLGKNRR